MIGNLIDLNKVTPYKIGADKFHDNVEALIYAVAFILVDFVENECGGLDGLEKTLSGHVESLAEHVKKTNSFEKDLYYNMVVKYDKIKYLYIQWTKTIPKLKEEEDDLLKKWSAERHGENSNPSDVLRTINKPDKEISEKCELLWKALSAKEAQVRAEIQEFLHGVVDMSEFLWT